MRFAVYHPWVYLTGGIERVLSEIVARSEHDWTIYTHHFEADSTFPTLRNSVVSLAPEVSVRRSLGPLVAACATIAASRLPDDGARALLVSSESVGDLILTRARVPAVCYCLTPLKDLPRSGVGRPPRRDRSAEGSSRVTDGALVHASPTAAVPALPARVRRQWRDGQPPRRGRARGCHADRGPVAGGRHRPFRAR